MHLIFEKFKYMERKHSDKPPFVWLRHVYHQVNEIINMAYYGVHTVYNTFFQNGSKVSFSISYKDDCQRCIKENVKAISLII